MPVGGIPGAGHKSVLVSRRSRICCDGKGVSRRGNTSINRHNKITLQSRLPSHSYCVYLWTSHFYCVYLWTSHSYCVYLWTSHFYCVYLWTSHFIVFIYGHRISIVFIYGHRIRIVFIYGHRILLCLFMDIAFVLYLFMDIAFLLCLFMDIAFAELVRSTVTSDTHFAPSTVHYISCSKYIIKPYYIVLLLILLKANMVLYTRRTRPMFLR